MKKYAAFINRSRTVPGDERSRTNPGHGYPEHTVTHAEVKEFESLDEMKKWAEKQEVRFGMLPEYRLVEYKELKVKTSVVVEIEDD